MKTMIAACALTVAILMAALPASAGYTSPQAGWASQAFTNGIP